MKVLFLYKYGILGGVCTQLFQKLKRIPKNANIEAHCGFLKDYGLGNLLKSTSYVHLDLQENALKKLLIEKIFDLIVVIDTPEYLAFLKKIQKKPPIILEVHTSIEKNMKYLSYLKEKDLKQVITISHYMKERVQSLLPSQIKSKVTLCQNLVSQEPISETNHFQPCHPILLWVGKIDDHKNWKSFFRIASEIVKNHPEIELWVVGGQTCPEKKQEEFFELAEIKGVLSQLKWFDRIEQNKMPELYSTVEKSGGLKLVTSHCESFAMTVVEALLSGCPVVASRVGAIPEITKEQSFFRLYELKNENSALKACLEILSQNKIVRKKIAQQRVHLEKKYNSEKAASYYWSTLKTFGKQNKKSFLI